MAKQVSIRSAIDEILAVQASVASREVASVAGISRQAAHRHLMRLVQLGVLRVEGHGRSVRYVRPMAGVVRADRSAASVVPGSEFWRPLVQRLDGLAYVRLIEVGGRFETRKEARQIISSLQGYRQILVDFRGVMDASDAFLRELVFKAPGWLAATVHAINLAPAVERAIERVRAHDLERPPAEENEYSEARFRRLNEYG